MATHVRQSVTGLEKYTFINLVCDGYERRHLTDTPGVYALCRACAKLILSELVERINYETDMYNSYTSALTRAHGTEWECLGSEIRANANKAKSKYAEYTVIAENLKNARLCTSACAMCVGSLRSPHPLASM